MTDAGDAYEALVEFLYRSPVGLLQIAADGQVELINPMSAQLLMPLSVDGGLDNLYDTLAGVAPQLRQLVARVQGSGVVCESLRLALPRSGSAAVDSRRPQVLSLSLLRIGADRLIAVLTDATVVAQREQHAIERRLDVAARTDGLTRLANRAGLREYLNDRLRSPSQGAGIAVLLLDCDRFAHVNETLGQAAGDQVLGFIADRLRSVLRVAPGRSIATAPVARIGGDEFVVVVEDAGEEAVRSLAERMLEVVAAPYRVDGHEVHCKASVGVVHWQPQQPCAAADADAVLRDTGLAMREAKRAGGGRWVQFTPAMRELAERRGSIEDDLRRAISAGELFVVYQPVVRLRPAMSGLPDGPVAGVEALVRWRHPVRGIVPPGEFIGIAEECGLIGAIGEQVLESACRHFAGWRAALGRRAPATLAVNLSRAQLAQPDSAHRIAAIVSASGVEPARLQLEVTESLAAQDASIQARLHELKALGVTLALDDFGTGYSSLSSLHLLPVDTVKIDRSFVAAAARNAHQRVLIEATVRVAASLGMDTVAEGIETEAEADIVRGLGCDKGQGYLYSRPLPAEALLEWLEQRGREAD